MVRSLLISAVIGALLMVPAVAGADDLEDLKAAHAKFNEVYSALDVDGVVEMIHGNAISFANKSPFPTLGAGKEAMRQSMSANLPMWENFQVTPLNVQYRIVEGVGLVAGNASYSYKLKDGPPESGFTRWFQVWTKVKGKWQMIASSVADIAVVSRD